MKTKKKFLWWVLMIIFIAPLYQSCKKYDEGPALSLRSKKARLAGKWEVIKYLKNQGNYFTKKIEPCYDYYYYSYCGPCTETYTGSIQYTIEFEKDGDVIMTENYNYSSYSKKYDNSDPDYYCSYYSCCDTSYSLTDSGIEITFGDWEFRKKKEELRLEMNYDGSLTKEDYEIARLTNDELKLKGFIGGGYGVPIEKVEIELKKK